MHGEESANDQWVSGSVAGVEDEVDIGGVSDVDRDDEEVNSGDGAHIVGSEKCIRIMWHQLQILPVVWIRQWTMVGKGPCMMEA